MRYLTVILGVLAMLVTLSGPVAALAVTMPCQGPSMAKMAMADEDSLCKPATKACTESCFAVGKCQSQCGSTLPLVRVDADNLASALFTMRLQVVGGEQPTGADSAIDGPPPRI